MADTVAVLKQIPSVERILQEPGVRSLIEQHGRRIVLEETQHLLEAMRAACLTGERTELPALHELEQELAKQVADQLRPGLSMVVNATGVVLHTNIGRAPLSEEMIDHVRATSRAYSNLEFDLAAGKRGHRDRHLSRLLQRLLQCGDATAVNNNAAALFLIVNTLAAGREVLVSRGELIEIGGSFRIPDILHSSGAILREVGTTNKTRIDDYQKQIGPATALILRVHPSNYRIVGFTARPSLAQLIELGRRHGIAVVEDLGSGCIEEVSSFGIPDEPTVRESLDAGVDLACFSGDKMLGGPQAGIIAGDKALIARLRSNPLMRALRLDKITFSLLEFVFLSYLRGTARQQLPVLQMLGSSREEIAQRAAALRQRLLAVLGPGFRLELVDGHSLAGGGAAPDVGLPSVLLALTSERQSASQNEKFLRGLQPPILARVEDDRVCLDLRTVLPEQEPILIESFRKLGGQV